MRSEDFSEPVVEASDPKETRVAWLVAFGALGIMALIFWRARSFVFDDAYISLRYAKNFVEHGQLVWNPGEYVEGYTNFLFVILSAGLIALGLPAKLAAQALAMVSFLCALALTVRILGRSAVGPMGLALGFATVVASVPLPSWTMSGMEAPLIAALVTAMLWAALPLASGHEMSDLRAGLAGLFGALAFLTRMDAAVPVASVIAGLALFGQAPRGKRLRGFLIVGGLGCFAAALQTCWRLLYYDRLLPNTFYAKVDVPTHLRFEFGANYLGKSLGELPLMVLSLLVAVVVLATRRIDGTRRSVFLACLAGVLSQILYLYLVGGDHLPAGRFIAPVVPLAAVSLGIGIQAWSLQLKRVVSVAALLAAGVTAVIATPTVHGGAAAGRVIGEYIRDSVPLDSTIALNVAGATPFVAEEHRFIDMLGLNDATIARRTDLPLRAEHQRAPGHVKGDGAYVLSRAPDMIIIGPADGVLVDEAYYLGEVELGESEDFARCYEPRVVTIPSEDTDWYRLALGQVTTRFTYYARVCDR